MNKDTIYNSPQQAQPFVFDERVAAVFPDMIQRSVPSYQRMIEGIQSLAQRFMKANTVAYDLGCSLGAASLAMSLGTQNDNCEIIAIDNSKPMLERAKWFIDAYKHDTPIRLVHGDITQYPIENASLIVLNFTLQFISIEERQHIINTIYNGLNKGGALIISEKVRASSNPLNELLIDLHHDFKRSNGYSDLEISQKRNALDNVLVPETIDDHVQRFKSVGFDQADVWIKHFNFCSMIAIK